MLRCNFDKEGYLSYDVQQLLAVILWAEVFFLFSFVFGKAGPQLSYIPTQWRCACGKFKISFWSPTFDRLWVGTRKAHPGRHWRTRPPPTQRRGGPAAGYSCLSICSTWVGAQAANSPLDYWLEMSPSSAFCTHCEDFCTFLVLSSSEILGLWRLRGWVGSRQRWFSACSISMDTIFSHLNHALILEKFLFFPFLFKTGSCCIAWTRTELTILLSLQVLG